MFKSLLVMVLSCQLSLPAAWSPKPVSAKAAQQKMERNSRKAIEEHLSRYPDEPYATVKQASEVYKINRELSFTHTAHELQGPRASMEDAKFFKILNEGVLLGVFDGHGGDTVANYANKVFGDKFQRALKGSENIRAIFEKVIDEISQECLQKGMVDGSTAVISFIDKTTGKVYTATLGDSEANIYRQINSVPNPGLRSIPLSCVRDWSSRKDAARAAIAIGEPSIAWQWPLETNPKFLRLYNSRGYGLNVSRALGDRESRGTDEKPGIIHKPKITVNQVMPGDIVVLGCDGLKDYVTESEIITLLNHPGSSAKTLVEYAVNTNLAQDNVSVIMVRIGV